MALPRGSTASASGIAPRPRVAGGMLWAPMRDARPCMAQRRGAVMLSIWVRPELPVLDSRFALPHQGERLSERRWPPSDGLVEMRGDEA